LETGSGEDIHFHLGSSIIPAMYEIHISGNSAQMPKSKVFEHMKMT
jgi:hypothetical protein